MYRIAHDIELIPVEDMNKRVIVTPVEDCRLPSPVADNELVNSVNHACEMMKELTTTTKVDRRRRKLPAIPANKKPLGKLSRHAGGSLADEIRATEHDTPPCASDSAPTKLIRQVSDRLYLEIDTSGSQPKSCLRLYDKSQGSGCHSGGSLSPEESRSRLSLDTGADSGNSTAHSPDGAKSLSPVGNGHPLSASSPSSTTTTSGGGVLQLHDATHRGLHRFIPRHGDEVAIDIGDPVYVSKEADDAWCEGEHHTSTSLVACAWLLLNLTAPGQQSHKERYLLDFLGSVEVSCHKGSEVFCQAIRKVAKAIASEVGVHGSHPCVLEITDQGLRMVDRGRPSPNHVPTHDYFFNLKNVTFCGYHPTDHKYFGFITKHPLRERFACHVFRAEASTREVAEAVGRAFRRFYQKFVETAYPVEDIYIE
ncbi:unnamed protein product [Ixodes hexagonus]